MDYSKLIEAVNRGERSTVNELLKDISDRLNRFLQIHMNASKQDAEDCVQQTLIKALDAIREGRIRDKERILSFMLSTSRNTYLNLLKKNERHIYDDFSDRHTQKPRQLLSLLDEERKKILKWCISQLSKNYKTFIEFWFTHPDSSAKAAANHFGISPSNVWTRKHRVLKQLSDCYQKKNPN